MTIRLWGQEKLVNTTTANSQFAPVVAGLMAGGYVIAWVDNMGANSSVVKFQLFDALGNKTGSETICPIADGEGDQSQPSITAMQDGGFVIALTDADFGGASDMHAIRYSAAGIMQIATELTDIDPLQHPVIFASTSGGYVLSYQTERPSASPGDVDLSRLTFDANNAISSNQVIENAPFIDTFTHDWASNSNSDLGFLLADQADVFESSLSATSTSRLTFIPITANGIQGSSVTLFRSFLAEIDAVSIASAGTNFVVAARLGAAPFSPTPELKFFVIGASGTILSTISSPANGTVTDSITAFETFGFFDGSFALLYETNGLLRINTYGESGNLTFAATLSASGLFDTVSAARLQDGRIVATWSETSGIDGEGAGVFQRIIDLREGVIEGSNNPAFAETMVGNDALGDTISGFGGNDTIYGLAGSDVIFGGNGNDTLNGGRGDDTLYGGADQDSLLGGLGADEIDGGAGIDTANYALASFAVTVSLDGTLEGTSEAFGDTYISVENLTGTNIAAQGDTLRGDAAANTMAGLAGNDFINAVGGHDRITGGAGIDTMTGGIGNDSFIYNTLSEGSDIITDFSSFAANNDDVLRFKGSVFGGLASGAIAVLQFQSSTADVAGTANVRFLYETDTRILRFDADGSGASAAVTIGTLQTGATMTFNDILIF